MGTRLINCDVRLGGRWQCTGYVTWWMNGSLPEGRNSGMLVEQESAWQRNLKELLFSYLMLIVTRAGTCSVVMCADPSQQIQQAASSSAIPTLSTLLISYAALTTVLFSLSWCLCLVANCNFLGTGMRRLTTGIRSEECVVVRTL
jgi:hypothetical protein